MIRHPGDRRPLAALLALLLALAVTACGTGGDERVEADRSTTTTGSPTGPAGTDGGTSTVDDRDPGDDVDGADPVGDAPSTEDLEALLPTADDVGPGYSYDPDSADDSDQDGNDSETDRAIEEACPAWAELEAMDRAQESSGDDAGTAFSAADERTVEITLSPTLEGFSEDQLDPLLDAVNACEELTLDVQGATMTMRMSGERMDIGDFGLRFSIDATVETVMGDLPIHAVGILFARDGVSGAVVASSGLDEATLREVPPDTQLVEPLARDLDAAVDDLVA